MAKFWDKAEKPATGWANKCGNITGAEEIVVQLLKKSQEKKEAKIMTRLDTNKNIFHDYEPSDDGCNGKER